MLVTNDEAVWRRAWSYKDHGKNYDAVFGRGHAPGFRWVHESFGSNWRMTEMQAAIGRIQLGKLPDWTGSRRAHAERLMAVLGQYPVIRVEQPPEYMEHAYYRLYAFVEPGALAPGWDRDRIMVEIGKRGIACFAGSCPEIYRERAFVDAGFGPDARLPNAQALGPLSLAFLVHPTLTEADLVRAGREISAVLSLAGI
jgi:dTDP-4-amino-4,6-dideoxygalactose transaminase